MKALLLILAFLGLVALTTPSIAHHRVVITQNYGGDVGHFDHEWQALYQDGARVAIGGICNSACTMFLGLPNTCVYPNATFGFHQARDGWGNRSPIGTQAMTRRYPRYLHVQMPPAPGLAVYTGWDLIRMGARPCN